MTALPVPAAVEVLEGCAPSAIPARVFESEVPVLLKGLVAGWPAVATCRQSLAAAASYLSGFWIPQPVTVYAYPAQFTVQARVMAAMMAHMDRAYLSGRLLTIFFLE